MTKRSANNTVSYRRAGLAAGLLLLGALCAAALPGLAQAGNNADDGRFEAASQSLSRGDYAKAERELAALTDARGFAPGVLQNLAQAYLAEGKVGQAIVTLSRARLLAPHDASIAKSLAAAREKAGVEAPPEGRLAKLAALLSVRQWIAWGSVTFGLFVVAVLLIAFRVRAQKTWRGLSVASALATLGCAVAVAAWGVQGEQAIVIVPEAEVRISPFDGADAAFSVREGETVTELGVHQGFLQVRARDGQTGWLDGRAVAHVVPKSDRKR